MINEIRKIKDIWNQFQCILTTPQKKWGVVVVIMTLIGAIFETLGVSIIFPLVQVMLNPEVLMNNKYLKPILSLLCITNRGSLVILIAAAVIAIYVIKNLYLTLLSYVRVKYACKVQRELSVEMMKAYVKHNYSYFLNTNTSVILRGMTSDISSTYNGLYQIFRLLAEVFTSGFIFAFIMVSDYKMAISMIILAAICLSIVLIGCKRWMKSCGELFYKYSAIINKILLQTFQGIKEVMVMGRQEYFVEEYENNYIKQQQATVGETVAMECPSYIIEGVCICGLIIAVCIKILSMDTPETIVPQLAAFAVGAFRILPSLGRISNSFNQFVFCLPSIKETYENISDARAYNTDQKKVKNKNASVNNFKNETIVLNNIVWNYDGSLKNVLNGINLKIQQGEAVAFIGASGAGKTTMADVLLGLLEPQEGQVTIDGIDIRTIPEIWHQMVGYVPQGVFLTDDTIRSNIAFGIGEEEIDDDKIWKALKQAQIDEFVKGLPNGFNTMIGERGARLSGGQCQRIAIARALYQEPHILILDEATSALDTETETALMDAIDSLQGKITLVIVAHRLSTIRNCDKIYEICGGNVVLKNKKDILKK